MGTNLRLDSDAPKAARQARVNPTMNDKSKKIVAALILPVTLFFFVIWSASTPWIGWCPESNFTLSPNSRLPKWFTVPSGYDRRDLTVELFFYAPPPPIKSNFKAILLGPPPDHRTLERRIGFVQQHPASKSYTDFPNYSIVSVNGIMELIEQREANDILYISDNPEMKQEIKILSN